MQAERTKKFFFHFKWHKILMKPQKNSLISKIPQSRSVLPELFFQKSPVLAIFWRKSAFCRHHPCFIAFLCGNVLAKYRQMAKIGDFGHFSVPQNRRFGDKSPLLAILSLDGRAIESKVSLRRYQFLSKNFDLKCT